MCDLHKQPKRIQWYIRNICKYQHFEGQKVNARVLLFLINFIFLIYFWVLINSNISGLLTLGSTKSRGSGPSLGFGDPTLAV